MFFRRNELKRLIIPEHSENDVADFVHDGPDSNALFFAGTFTGVIIVNDRVHGRFCCFIHFQVVDGEGRANGALEGVGETSAENVGFNFAISANGNGGIGGC